MRKNAAREDRSASAEEPTKVLAQQLDEARRALDRERAERVRLETQLHSEETVRASEERFRLLIEHVGEAVFMLDCSGNVATWARGAEKVFGYTTAEALQLHVDDFLLPEERGGGAEELARALAQGRVETEGWRLGKDGRRIWARVVACPIFGPCAELRGFAEIIENRTELHAVEEVLATHAADLARSNRDLEAFASVAAHDLQEPLRKLRTFSDRLRRSFASSLHPDAQTLVGRIESAASRMQSLVEGVLAYARAGSKARTEQRVDLEALVSGVIADLSGRIEAAEASVELTGLPVVTMAADATALRQVFQNLIYNSLKFARPGVRPVVRLSASMTATALELRVEDNGIGFEPRHQERIFGLFARLHGRDEYEGSGIGLAICRRIVEAHGGTIAATGDPGKGAVFTISLPLKLQNTSRKA